jgi:hypothetical protein
MSETAVALHVWDTEPQEEPEAVRQLSEMYGKLVVDPGFIWGRVLETADRTSVATVMETRTVEDRLRILSLPDVRQTMEHLPGTVSLVVRIYEEVGHFRA